jgi:hypothetical protein
MSFFPLASIAVFFLLACGQAPLTGPQTDRLRATVETVSQAFQGIELVSGQSPRKMATPDEWTKHLQRSVEQNLCSIPQPLPQRKHLPLPSGTPDQNTQPIRFTIDGAKCPVQVQFSMEPKGTAKNGVFDFKLTYEVKDAAWREKNEVEYAELTGKLETQGNLPNDFAVNDRAEIPSLSVKTIGSFEASVLTKKEGRVRATLAYNQATNFSSGAKMAEYTSTTLFTWAFSDFTAELSGTVDKARKMVWTLNGEPKTDAEIGALFSGLSLK